MCTEEEFMGIRCVPQHGRLTEVTRELWDKARPRLSRGTTHISLIHFGLIILYVL